VVLELALNTVTVHPLGITVVKVMEEKLSSESVAKLRLRRKQVTGPDIAKSLEKVLGTPAQESEHVAVKPGVIPTPAIRIAAFPRVRVDAFT
jgi:hypothetical protein